MGRGLCWGRSREPLTPQPPQGVSLLGAWLLLRGVSKKGVASGLFRTPGPGPFMVLSVGVS